MSEAQLSILDEPAPALFAAGMSYLQLISQAHVVTGFDLERNKANLVGIPFVITGITFRDGTKRGTRTDPILTNYLSVELVVADAATLKRRLSQGRVDVTQLERVSPNEQLVINDGSTGIARQLVSYLHHQNLIEVPAGQENGGMGESRWDTYRTEWLRGFNIDNPYPAFTVCLACPRGLRVSEYTNDQSPDEANTFYLA